MISEAQYVRQMSESLQQVATQLVPAHVGEMRQTIVAASGWCAPTDLEWERRKREHWMAREASRRQRRREQEIEQGDRLACGCTWATLETGWHETGCEIVGEHLCRPVMKPQLAAKRSPAVVYEA